MIPSPLLAALVATILMAPGALFASLRKESDWATFICDTVLFASIVDSALYWLVPLRALPLGIYAGLLVCLAVAGLVSVALTARRMKLPAIESPMQRAVALTLGLVLAAYAVIGLSRAQIDWDAITYYLFTALGYTLAGHVSGLQTNAITIGTNVPMAFPPILPTMYAEALTIAGWLHGSGDGAVRLLPFCYLCAVAAATARLCRRFVPGMQPTIAALAFLLTPATINYMVAQALSLDMLNAFAFTLLMVELFDDEWSTWSAARVGLTASLLIMSKVTGPLLVVFAFAAIAPRYLGTRAARAVATLVALALIGSTWFVNPPATASPWFYVACAIFFAVLVSAAQRLEAPRWPTWQAAAAAVAALAPAILYIAGLMATVGSPATFYLGAFVNTHSPNYAWANQLIVGANAFDSQNMPGLPQLYGLDVFLWWGTPAISMVLAGVGAILALRARDRICALLIPLALFELSFMTLFGQGDFRRLLPVTPFVVLFVVYAALRVPLLRRAPAAAVLTVSALGFPFAWTAQQTIFAAPVDILNSLAFDQWHAAGGTAIVNTLIYGFIMGVAATAAYLALDVEREAVRRFIVKQRDGIVAVVAIVAAATAVSAFLSLLVAADPRPALASLPVAGLLLAVALIIARGGPSTLSRLPAGAALFFPVALAALIFEPVLATAAGPGLQPWAERVESAQYYGYLATLDEIERTQPDGSVLTFEGYGVPWFSRGRLRRVELTDAFDLGLLRNALAQRNRDVLSVALRRFGVRSAILPARDGPLRPEYDRLVSRLPGLALLDDPQFAARLEGDAWSAYRILPRTDARVADWARVAIDTRSGGASTAIRIDIDPAHVADGRSATVRATIVSAENSGATRTAYVELTRDLRGKGGLVVPLRDLVARVAPDAPPGTLPMRIDIDSLDVDFASGVLAWRASNFSATRGDAGWMPANGDPQFVPDADAAPMLSVRLTNSRQSGGVELYPEPPAPFGIGSILAPELKNDYAVISIALAASRDCPAGTPYDVTSRGSLSPLPAEGARKGFRLSNGARAGGEAIVDFRGIEAAFPAPERLTLKSLTIAARSMTCKSRATIAFPHLAIDRVGELHYVVDGSIEPPAVIFGPGSR